MRSPRRITLSITYTMWGKLSSTKGGKQYTLASALVPFRRGPTDHSPQSTRSSSPRAPTTHSPHNRHAPPHHTAPPTISPHNRHTTHPPHFYPPTKPQKYPKITIYFPQLTKPLTSANIHPILPINSSIVVSHKTPTERRHNPMNHNTTKAPYAPFLRITAKTTKKHDTTPSYVGQPTLSPRQKIRSRS